MKWIELSVQTPAEFVEPLSQIFHRYGHGGIALESIGGYNPDEGESAPDDADVILRAYLPLDSTADQRRENISVAVQLVASIAPLPPLNERAIEEEAWQESWKSHFHVLRIGKRIAICPTWRDHLPKPDEIVISLDPGMAFGTGHHPTTRMCLEYIEALVQPGHRVLDVGCGSGILSIASAKLGSSEVIGYEVEEAAARVARENVNRNGVETVVKIIRGTLEDQGKEENGYDIAVANISAKVVSDIASLLARAVSPGGHVVASGIVGDRKDEVSGTLKRAGLTPVDEKWSDDWVALVYSAANRTQLREH